MTGIQYVTDENGRMVAVQIDLTKTIVGNCGKTSKTCLSHGRGGTKSAFACQGKSRTHQKRQALT